MAISSIDHHPADDLVDHVQQAIPFWQDYIKKQLGPADSGGVINSPIDLEVKNGHISLGERYGHHMPIPDAQIYYTAFLTDPSPLVDAVSSHAQRIKHTYPALNSMDTLLQLIKSGDIISQVSEGILRLDQEQVWRFEVAGDGTLIEHMNPLHPTISLEFSNLPIGQLLYLRIRLVLETRSSSIRIQSFSKGELEAALAQMVCELSLP